MQHMKRIGLIVLLCVSGWACGESAYEWETVITLESVSNLDGGVEKGSRQLGNLDLTLSVNTSAADWWDNGQLFVYVLGDYGNNPSELTGDWQGVSNIATDDSIKIYEFWYEHRFVDDSVKVLLGLHDYNSTFYSLDSAGLFSHPSFGIGPDTSQVGPSIFSTTAMALHVTIEGSHRYVLLAVYDGIPGDPNNPRGTHIQFDKGDGVFLATELGVHEEENYKLGVGAWQHTAEVENPVTGELIDKNSGIYIIGEKYWTERLATFIQAGRADKELNQVEYYYGAGIVVSHLFQEEDSIGVAVAHSRNGDPYLNSYPEYETAETAYELSYFTPVNSYLSVQSSLYYIHNPSMDKGLDDALAVGLRAYIQF